MLRDLNYILPPLNEHSKSQCVTLILRSLVVIFVTEFPCHVIIYYMSFECYNTCNCFDKEA